MHAPTRAGLPNPPERSQPSPDQAHSPPHGPETREPRAGAGALTFTHLKWTSFAHSCVYVGLLVCAFAAGKPEPITFVLGLTHGVLWIFMSLACLTAARLRIVPLRLAVAVAVLGGVGPFFGSFEFVREQRNRPR
ncbi:MAG: hypothetical protein ACHQAV_03925 [Solirubrobacterales bacterium]